MQRALFHCREELGVSGGLRAVLSLLNGTYLGRRVSLQAQLKRTDQGSTSGEGGGETGGSDGS
jgi:hypothetical protein